MISGEKFVPESEYVAVGVAGMEQDVDNAAVFRVVTELRGLVEHGVEQMYSFLARGFLGQEGFAEVH